ncbi:hypothetical protein HPB47_016258 [Ixodes persulcatus]|uniref:Uncharacterized protein n=1 Tax=Ixodes persulcatus TaxID=34615 RepID=A0AC60QRC4_IXOPE|nr:hypothetical protein HPB47_016258 [Ixodes persulcatus]
MVFSLALLTLTLVGGVWMIAPKCALEGNVCHFLRQACCENLTCIRYTASSPMTGICHLNVHTGNEYSVPSIPTRKPEPKPVLPPVEHFVPPSGPPRNPLVLKLNPDCCPC